MFSCVTPYSNALLLKFEYKVKALMLDSEPKNNTFGINLFK